MSPETYRQLIADLSWEFFEAFCTVNAPPHRPARPDHWGMYCAGHEL